MQRRAGSAGPKWRTLATDFFIFMASDGHFLIAFDFYHILSYIRLNTPQKNIVNNFE